MRSESEDEGRKWGMDIKAEGVRMNVTVIGRGDRWVAAFRHDRKVPKIKVRRRSPRTILTYPKIKVRMEKLLCRVTLLSWLRNNASARMTAFDKGGVVQCLMRVERGEGGTSN